MLPKQDRKGVWCSTTSHSPRKNSPGSTSRQWFQWSHLYLVQENSDWRKLVSVRLDGEVDWAGPHPFSRIPLGTQPSAGFISSSRLQLLSYGLQQNSGCLLDK